MRSRELASTCRWQGLQSWLVSWFDTPVDHRTQVCMPLQGLHAHAVGRSHTCAMCLLALVSYELHCLPYGHMSTALYSASNPRAWITRCIATSASWLRTQCCSKIDRQQTTTFSI